MSAMRDRLFAADDAPPGDFVFDERVVRVFPDMIQRSVPGYSLVLQLTALLARRHVQPGSRVYDLGCSLGAATRAMRQAVAAEGVRFFAADNSPDMVARCRALLAEDDARAGDQADAALAPVDVIQADIADIAIEDASMTVLNYTLQFVDPDRREALLARIAAGTRPDGVLLLSEKIALDDSAEQALQAVWHHDFKRAQGYSDLEIARKRDALERVLRPDTEAVHRERLRAAGWVRVVRVFQAFNFASYLAFR